MEEGLLMDAFSLIMRYSRMQVFFIYTSEIIYQLCIHAECNTTVLIHGGGHKPMYILCL